MDSFRPMLSYERRDDDMKMVLLRLLSAVSLVFFVIQLAKEPENLSSLSSFTNDSMDDLFNWGNDKFVLGRQLADKSGNSTVGRRKSPQEVFMEAIMDDPEEVVVAAPNDTVEDKKSIDDIDGEENVIDRDSIGGSTEDDEDETPKTNEL